MTPIFAGLVRSALLASTALLAPGAALAVNTTIDGNNGTLPLPTGQYVTPVAPLTNATQIMLNPGLPNHPNFIAGEAVRARLSPDGTTLAILTAGQNTNYRPSGQVEPNVIGTDGSNQYVFLYNVAGANKTSPRLTQVLQQPNAHVGLAWSNDGNTIYTAGGNDDCVYVYTRGAGGSFGTPAQIRLGHGALRSASGVGLGVQPNASGLALSADSATLVVANNYNDSISVIDTATRTVRYEHDLRPYLPANEGTSGVAGGEYPFAVAILGNGTAYVSSTRDRQVVAIDISGATSGRLIKRIALSGNAYGLAFNASQSLLFVAQDNADEVAAIDTASNTVIATADARAPAGVIAGTTKYTGAGTFAVTVSPDQNTLYAVNNAANSIAVIPLTGPNTGLVTGLIPTGYAPKDVVFSADGTEMYIVNGKSNTGPNPGHLASGTSRLTEITYPGGNAAAAAAATGSNQYQFQLERASLVTAQVPTTAELPALTAQVVRNNSYNDAATPADIATMNFLKGKITHVIYILKENRTFDQVLGDLNNGSAGDPTLTQFGRRITPNFHRLATNFVTLDNYFDLADGSMDGWSWGMRGRLTPNQEITQQINYAGVNRGLSYESEGSNRNIPVGLASAAQRDAATVALSSAYPAGAFTPVGNLLPGGAANLLPGIADSSAGDAPFGYQKSFIFESVLAAGQTVRNYGWMGNNIGRITNSDGTPITNAGAAGVVQTAELNPTLAAGLTDVYFRGYDQNYPDQFTFNEWNREFQQYVAGGNLPNLELIRFSHDHTGSYGTALAGVNTPETQQADNDLAVARLVEAVARSPYASSTLIIATEDDSQDGPDHIDSHRTTTYMVGPYVKQRAVVSTRYNQISLLRTIEDILGTPHLNLYDAFQRPMADVFDITSSGAWTYSAVASTVLKTTTLQLSLADSGIQYAEGPDVVPTHDATYWAEKTRGFDFSKEDRVPTDLFNEVLWNGLMDGVAYPAPHTTTEQ